MIIYFAGTGSLKKGDIEKTNKIAKARLLSYLYVLKGQPQQKIFKLIKNGTVFQKSK